MWLNWLLRGWCSLVGGDEEDPAGAKAVAAVGRLPVTAAVMVVTADVGPSSAPIV